MANKLNLTQIINADDKTMDAEAKIEAISAKVNRARKAYGNSDVVIATPVVNTCEGKVDLKFLSDSDKVALAGTSIRNIRMRAIEAVKATDGAVLDREIERLLAVDSVLVNLFVTSDSEYI